VQEDLSDGSQYSRCHFTEKLQRLRNKCFPYFIQQSEFCLVTTSMLIYSKFIESETEVDVDTIHVGASRIV